MRAGSDPGLRLFVKGFFSRFRREVIHDGDRMSSDFFSRPEPIAVEDMQGTSPLPFVASLAPGAQDVIRDHDCSRDHPNCDVHHPTQFRKGRP